MTAGIRQERQADEPTIVQRTEWWRAALVGSGVIAILGGGMHPASESSEDPLRKEFADMMSDDAWIPGHTLGVVSAILLALAVRHIHKNNLWPTAIRPVAVAAVVLPLYVIETIFHLFSYLDVDRLESGAFPPVAWTHVGLAAVLYPATGLTVVWLALKLAPSWATWQRVFAYGGVIGGVAFALSLPLTLIFPDMETSPFFAVGAILIAVWSIAAGLVGIRSRA